MTPMLLAGILALLGGTGGFVDSIIEGIKTKNDAYDQKRYQEELYELEKINAKEEFEQAKEEAGRNADQADLQADLSDTQQDISEKIVSGDFNSAIDNMYLSQTSDAWSWNDALAQIGSSSGSAYASIAGSGVRAGSSLSDAVMIDTASNAAQLQFAQDTKRQNDSNSLASVLNNLAGNRFDIMQNRIGADITRSDAAYLRNSYLEGGRNYNLYQDNLDIMKKNYEYNQSVLDKTIKRNSGGWAWLNAMGSAFSMGAKGFTSGYNLGNTIELNSGFNKNKYTKNIGEK